MTKNQPDHDRTSDDSNRPGGITALLDKPGEDAPSTGRSSENNTQQDKGDEKKDPKEKHDPDDQKEKEPEKTPVYKRPGAIISVFVVLAIAIIGGIVYWLHARHYVSTDDA